MEVEFESIHQLKRFCNLRQPLPPGWTVISANIARDEFVKQRLLTYSDHILVIRGFLVDADASLPFLPSN